MYFRSRKCIWCHVEHVRHLASASMCFKSHDSVPHLVGQDSSWWCHQKETFSALLAIYAGNLPVPGEFPAQRPMTGSFDVFFDLRLNKWPSKQSWGWWFETLSRPLWRHCNVLHPPVNGNVMKGKRCCRSLIWLRRETLPSPFFETWLVLK